LLPGQGAVLVAQDDLDGCLVGAVRAVLSGIIDQVGELLGADPGRPGQPQGKQDRVDDVRLARAVRPAEGREIVVEGDLGAPAGEVRPR
jgi:hypothetical protein